MVQSVYSGPRSTCTIADLQISNLYVDTPCPARQRAAADGRMRVPASRNITGFPSCRLPVTPYIPTNDNAHLQGMYCFSDDCRAGQESSGVIFVRTACKDPMSVGLEVSLKLEVDEDSRCQTSLPTWEEQQLQRRPNATPLHVMATLLAVLAAVCACCCFAACVIGACTVGRVLLAHATDRAKLWWVGAVQGEVPPAVRRGGHVTPVEGVVAAAEDAVPPPESIRAKRSRERYAARVERANTRVARRWSQSPVVGSLYTPEVQMQEIVVADGTVSVSIVHSGLEAQECRPEAREGPLLRAEVQGWEPSLPMRLPVCSTPPPAAPGRDDAGTPDSPPMASA